jgi:hypothetical protein
MTRQDIIHSDPNPHNKNGLGRGTYYRLRSDPTGRRENYFLLHCDSYAINSSFFMTFIFFQYKGGLMLNPSSSFQIKAIN